MHRPTKFWRDNINPWLFLKTNGRHSYTEILLPILMLTYCHRHVILFRSQSINATHGEVMTSSSYRYFKMAAGSHVRLCVGNIRQPTKCNCRSQLGLHFQLGQVWQESWLRHSAHQSSNFYRVEKSQIWPLFSTGVTFVAFWFSNGETYNILWELQWLAYMLLLNLV